MVRGCGLLLEAAIISSYLMDLPKLRSWGSSWSNSLSFQMDKTEPKGGKLVVGGVGVGSVCVL